MKTQVLVIALYHIINGNQSTVQADVYTVHNYGGLLFYSHHFDHGLR